MNMSANKRKIHLLGYASGIAGVNHKCGEAPIALQKTSYLQQSQFIWDGIYTPRPHQSPAEETKRLCLELALNTAKLTKENEFFIVLGGDHTSAIGTWSGVFTALHTKGPFGLIWIDAHMDSHVPETSASGRFHGMPLASLLGYGDQMFTQLLAPLPKVQPHQLCLIGVRSYEPEEARLLKQLNVRVFYIEEVMQRGLQTVFDEALELVNKGTIGYGISLDIDSIDPLEAPAVDVPESGGLKVQELMDVLAQVSHDPRLIGAEIVEFNPSQDKDKITENMILGLIQAITG